MKRWTKSEERILRDHYSIEGTNGCAARLKCRSKNAIAVHAVVMGLKRDTARLHDERSANGKKGATVAWEKKEFSAESLTLAMQGKR